MSESLLAIDHAELTSDKETWMRLDISPPATPNINQLENKHCAIQLPQALLPTSASRQKYSDF